MSEELESLINQARADANSPAWSKLVDLRLQGHEVDLPPPGHLLWELLHERDEARLTRGLEWWSEQPDKTAMRQAIVSHGAPLVLQSYYLHHYGLSEDPLERAQESFLMTLEAPEVELLREVYGRGEPGEKFRLLERIRELARPALLEIFLSDSPQDEEEWEAIRAVLLAAGLVDELFRLVPRADGRGVLAGQLLSLYPTRPGRALRMADVPLAPGPHGERVARRGRARRVAPSPL